MSAWDQETDTDGDDENSAETNETKPKCTEGHSDQGDGKHHEIDREPHSGNPHARASAELECPSRRNSTADSPIG
jgi:hypothetical protein